MKRRTDTAHSSTDKQPRISSFFAQKPSLRDKRSRSTDGTIDLTLEDSGLDEQPPIKKLKTTKGNSRGDEWRFDSGRKQSAGRPVAGEEGDKKKRRHEEFKRVLLADNSSFARQRHQIQRTQSSDDESLQEGDDDSEADARDEAFNSLSELYSHKDNKKKGKTRLASSAKGKGESEGSVPSGEPYTPAELQASSVNRLRVAFNNLFMQSQSLKFIKEHPGVVLMIERGYKYYFFEESASVWRSHWTDSIA